MLSVPVSGTGCTTRVRYDVGGGGRLQMEWNTCTYSYNLLERLNVPGSPRTKSEVRAHQMARICGVPASLRKKSELSSHQMAHPGQLRIKNPS